MPLLTSLFRQPLPVGSPAPGFSLSDQNGAEVSLSQFRGAKNVVLVFYPGDDTSTCTRQLCEFRDSWGAVDGSDTVVFGVNPQSAAKHRHFVSKFQFPFPLLVDSGQRVARLYGASGLLVRRTVYLVGKSGAIRFSRRGKPLPSEVLAAAE